jgi:hypothetical protein
MATPRSIERNQGWRVVTIREVNPAQNHIQAEDQYGTPIMIDVTGLAAFLQVPQVGEVWVVQRRGSDWLLDSRYDPPDVTLPFSDLNAGDVRIEAPGTIWIAGNVKFLGSIEGIAPTVIRVPSIPTQNTQVGTTRAFPGDYRPSIGVSPPGSPQAGDEWIYNGTAGVYWRFVYDATETTYKWKFVGGPPISSIQAGSQSTTSASYVDFSPSVTTNFPRAGDYLIQYKATIDNSSGNGQTFLGLNINGTVVDDDSYVAGTRTTAASVYNATGVTAGWTVKLQWHTNGGVPNLGGKDFSMIITPIRVI